MSHACGEPVEQRHNCSTSEEADTSGDDIFCGRLGSGLSVRPVRWVARNLTGSRSDTAVPLRTAKNSALQRPRQSPLKDSGSRQLARAAPRRNLRCVHAGNETISQERSKPPVLSRSRQHDMKATIPVRASWRLQRARWRGLVGIGI